jgi:ketosteroid isomerase-like protein
MARRKFLALAVIWPWAAHVGAAEPARIPQPQAMDAVLKALGDLADAVRTEDPLAFRALLDDTAIGNSQLRQGFAQLVAAEDQLRLHFSEVQLVVQGELAEVRPRWERRSLVRVRGMLRPKLRTGSAVLQFGRQQGTWRLRAIFGDNPFAPSR